MQAQNILVKRMTPAQKSLFDHYHFNELDSMSKPQYMTFFDAITSGNVVFIVFERSHYILDVPSSAKPPVRPFGGTVRFDCIDVLSGHNCTYRGSIETLVYNLCYWIRQHNVPWSQHSRVEARREKLAFAKDITLCAQLFHTFPAVIHTKIFAILHYARHLTYEERPDYVWLHTQIDAMFHNWAES